MNENTEVNGPLVARARAKAARRGTTLEAEVEAWLTRYVDGADEDADEPDFEIHGRESFDVPPPAQRRPAPRYVDTPKRRSTPADPSDQRSSSEAYRRLLRLMTNGSKSTS